MMMNRVTENSKSLFWILNVSGWVGYAVLNFLMGIAGHDREPDYIFPSLMYAAGGLAVTFWLRFVYKWAWELRPWLSLILSGLSALTAAIAFAGFRSFVYMHVYESFRVGDFPLSEYFYTLELTLSLYVICTWSGLYFGIKYYRMAQQQREQVLKATSVAHEAQLRTLRHQLNPHFLFNTLNAITTLVLESENDTADRMLTRLSAFLRSTLDRDPMQKVTLEDEIEALDLYLELERLRFDDRLEINLEIEEAAFRSLVPSMILQPLIENAVRHATTVSEAGGLITIVGQVKDDMLCVSVADNGPGTPNLTEHVVRSKTSVGVTNTQERLQVLYGDSHRIDVSEVPPQGQKVEMCIPLEYNNQ